MWIIRFEKESKLDNKTKFRNSIYIKIGFKEWERQCL